MTDLQSVDWESMELVELQFHDQAEGSARREWVNGPRNQYFDIHLTLVTDREIVQ